ncbi:hypothetical protein NGF19_20125 [Streptomyces sp. RY43-2]|uniref:Uncharacterized protein n=1 Tax=Streptomyces macrolidinus TaxID=2952607 RepID=A0ABT0ZHK4_9ACTN|nr:hypothetical protein [Streptomyces macrolidinus]MCN9243078.1 hypothetical protein [Streptomyces macrolidinus]
MTTILLLVLLPLFFLSTVASGLYFLVVLPNRWRLPYEESLALLDSDDRDELERADRLLGQAVNAGPRGKGLSRIRFAQAYVRAMLGTYEPARYAAAATVLDELVAADGHSAHTAYLELWVQSRLENHDRVTDLYAERRELLDTRPDSRRIAALSHLQLAVGHWRRRETDGALHHFDRVRELGELTERIPPQVNDLHLVKGVQAVFDGRTDDARNAFTDARRRSVEHGAPTAQAEVGLLVCDWTEGDPRKLGEWLGRLAQEVERELAELPTASDTESDEDADADVGADAGERRRTAELLRTGIAVLRLIALVREWLRRPALSGAPSAADFAEFDGRVDAVRAADPELGDAALVGGLVHYYFALSQPERERALAELHGGTELAKGIMLPEVLDLMERERALGGEGDAISRYLALLTEFLDDPDRSPEDRAQFRRLKAKFTRFQDAEGIEDGAVPTQRSAPDDHRRRSQELRRRIEGIVYPRVRDLPDDAPAKVALRELLADLDRACDVYGEGAEVLHGAEQKLITSTGAILLPEETE